MSTARSFARFLLMPALLALAITTGCSNWRAIEVRERWTLYAKEGESIDASRFERALTPAFLAVSEKLGPFESRVRVHAWNEPRGESDAPQLSEIGAERVESVPGIGKARVRAYHVTGGGALFEPSGVFLGTTDMGTVVHELVHARLAETDLRVPLWFEEGLASLWGDGAQFDGRWVFDGFACWPARVLRDERIEDDELTRVMGLSASESYTPRENLLVHFVGWAVVFDLARSEPGAGPREWLANFQADAQKRGILVATRERVARSIDPSTIKEWLGHLRHPDPGRRLAAAKGLWKLRSQPSIEALIAALAEEQHPQVRLALGLNALLAVGEMRLSRRTWRELWRKVVPALSELDLTDGDEARALDEFISGMRGRGGATQRGLDSLSRYWEE